MLTVAVCLDGATEAVLRQRATAAGLPVAQVARALLMVALGTACPTCGRSRVDHSPLAYETKEAPHGHPE